MTSDFFSHIKAYLIMTTLPTTPDTREDSSMSEAQLTLLAAFRASFYNLYFHQLDDFVVVAAMDEVSLRAQSLFINRRCPTLYTRYLVLSTVLFLNTMQVSVSHQPCLNEEGEEIEGEGDTQVQVQDLNTPSLTAFVQKDSVYDTSRSFHKPVSDPSRDTTDVPLGTIKSDLQQIIDGCDRSLSTQLGFGSAYPKHGSRSVKRVSSRNPFTRNKGCS